MDRRGEDELEAPLLESAPLPEKRRSTFLTVCPFILGKGQIRLQPVLPCGVLRAVIIAPDAALILSMLAANEELQRLMFLTTMQIGSLFRH